MSRTFLRDLHHPPRVDVGPDIRFHEKAEAEAEVIEGGHSSHPCLIEDDGTADID